MSAGSRHRIHSRNSESEKREKSRDRDSSPDDIPTHTSNPRLKEARIFVGNVAHPKVSQSDLEDKFSKYGKILGISVHRGFAFVQFERASVAEKAIQEQHLTMFKGVRIDVKTAATSEDLRANGRARSRNQRSLSPKHSRDHSRDFGREMDDRDWDRHRDGRDRSPLRRDRDYFDERHKREAEDVLDPNRPNDCEIIVVLKHLRAYAESVERRLKNLGLTVDLLFLKDEAALLPTIDDIARRGSLFAIVIADQNESHRSVTLNILHGTPQEHRNMPLDDAMKLVAINYHEYVQTLRDKKMKGLQGTSVAPVLAAIPDHPSTASSSSQAVPGRNSKLQNLLNLLNDGKFLTSVELGVILEYVTQQRNEILARERGDHLQDTATSLKSSNSSRDPVNSVNEFELQQQNPPANWQYDNSSGTPSVSQVPAVAPVQEQSSGSSRGGNNSFLNFDNPTVQKALDSLIQSGPNLLQKVLGNTDQSANQKEKLPEYNQDSSIGGSDSSMRSNYNQGDQHQMRSTVQDDSHSSMMRNQAQVDRQPPMMRNQGQADHQESMVRNPVQGNRQQPMMRNPGQGDRQKQMMRHQDPGEHQQQMMRNQGPSDRQQPMMRNQDPVDRQQQMMRNQDPGDRQQPMMRKQGPGDRQQQMMRNQGPGDRQQQLMRSQDQVAQPNQLMHDQYASQGYNNPQQIFGNMPKQEDDYMQRQPPYNQNQRQYPPNPRFNNPNQPDRSGGVRHPLLGTPVSNRFPSPPMGRGMQRPQQHESFY